LKERLRIVQETDYTVCGVDTNFYSMAAGILSWG